MENSSKSQPTILVKKADGTTERITLQEFRNRKQVSISQASVEVPKVLEKKAVMTPPTPPRRVIPLVEEEEIARPTQTAKPTVPQPPRRVIPLVEEVEVVKPSVPSKVVSTTPVVQTETHIANTTPVTKVFESSYTLRASADRQPANSKQKVDDHNSLLDEDDSEIKAIGDKKGQSVRHTPAASVSFSSSVQIPKDLEARTSALILSWKKGIRDQYQFIDYAARPASEGGLGLTKVDAVKLFEEISQSATLGAPRIPRPASLSSAVPLTSPISTPSQKKPQLNHIPSSATLIREIAPTREPATVMGPIEEAASLSIEDFRRLSRIPKTAGEMMVAKFSGWKDESYLLYLQVRDSWRNSPLFRLYIEKTTEAIEKNLTITAVLERAQLSYEEYLEIALINRKLGMMD
ncbi:MAG TPA: hypothetical protein PK295_04105 [Candidatus Magasanikbacteria bacterium]|nr:hypothetical protein [Candidatus Magasanikbacteria bacterium]